MFKCRDSPCARENSTKGRGLGRSQPRKAGSTLGRVRCRYGSLLARAQCVSPLDCFVLQRGIPLRTPGNTAAASYRDSSRSPSAARVDANYP